MSFRKGRVSRLRSQCLLLSAAALSAAAIVPATSSAATRDVVAVGNAFGGTVSFLDGHTYNNLGSVNVVPDLAWRKTVLFLNPITLVGYQGVKSQKGGENYVDDVALSPDGTRLYVSRGILEDVAAFDLRTKKLLWRTNVGGFEADHMAISPDGSRIYVSDTTNGLVKAFNAATGAITGQFSGGTYTHEIDFSRDGKTLYVGSIGTTLLPYALNALKGDRQLTVADAATMTVKKVYTFDDGLRPDAFMPDERTAYFQLSYHRGFVEFNLDSGTITRTMNLPSTPQGDALFPDKLPANSMHHGLALSADTSTICNAGTIDNYVAMVNRATFTVKKIVTGFAKPYWAENSLDGTKCLVSNSDGDYVSVMDYATGNLVKNVAVGNYPQRERNGKLDTSVVLSSAAG